mmetsp:Transcript_3885/g.7800  ORF Transcript_3885/g.7800 Transcript_3885/m.7800 type:complete len:201 (-) Transcript_3885:551-1153(-)
MTRGFVRHQSSLPPSTRETGARSSCEKVHRDSSAQEPREWCQQRTFRYRGSVAGRAGTSRSCKKSFSESWPNSLKMSSQALRMPASMALVLDLKAFATTLKMPQLYAFKDLKHCIASLTCTSSTRLFCNSFRSSVHKPSRTSASKNFVRLSARHAARTSAGPKVPLPKRFCSEGASVIIRPKLCTKSNVSAFTSSSFSCG